jgi:hypothetical protein
MSDRLPKTGRSMGTTTTGAASTVGKVSTLLGATSKTAVGTAVHP